MLQFQCIKPEESDGNLNDPDESIQYTVSLFGRAENGRDVCCHVYGFWPYHYLRVPKNISFAVFRETVQQVVDARKRNKSIEISDVPVIKKPNYGFQNGRTDQLLKISCKSLRMFYFVQKSIRAAELDWVDRMKPIVRFWGDQQLLPAGWYQVPEDWEETMQEDQLQTWCDVEFSCHYSEIARYLHRQKLGICAQMVEVTFDIETYTADRKTGGIDPSLPANLCFCVGITVHRAGILDEQWVYYVTPLHNAVFEQPNFRLVLFPSEKKMLEGVGQLLFRIRPDLIYGYNSDQFDFWYMFERAQLCNCNAEFWHFSKVREVACTYKEETFSSSARGDAFFKRPFLPGILAVDVYVLMQSDTTKKFSNYTLRHVAQAVTGETKLDLTYTQMFEFYEKAHMEGLLEIAKYCLQDVLVTYKVAAMDAVLPKLVEFSNLVGVEPLWIITRGQTIRCVSALYAKYQLPQYNYYFSNIDEPAEELGGGHVFEPMRGVYKDPTIVLDFKSLYPSIMIGRQFDYTSIVLDSKYLHIPGIKYYTCSSVHPTNGSKMVSTFAQSGPTCKHVIPDLLQNLSDTRQAIKKQMRSVATKDPLYTVLDSKQNALKTSMNSFYGFLGARQMPLEPLAQSITGEGRNLLMQSKTEVESECLPDELRDLVPQKPFVVYGDTDSIFVHCPGADEKQAAAFGKRMASYLTDTVFACRPIEQEFEKTLVQLCLLNRKNYVYTVRERSGELALNYYGGEIVKRDYSDYFKSVYKQICEVLLVQQRQPEEALALLQKGMDDLVNDRVDLYQLCETRRLSAKYKVRDTKFSVGPYDDVEESMVPNIPAVRLARLIKQRAPGEEPSIGSRFSFIKTLDFSKEDTKSLQVELVEYVIENKIKVDYGAYLEKDTKPFEKLFAVVGKTYSEKAAKMIYEYQQMYMQFVNKQRAIYSQNQEKMAKKLFFDGTRQMAATVVPFQSRKKTQRKHCVGGGEKSIADFFVKK